MISHHHYNGTVDMSSGDESEADRNAAESDSDDDIQVGGYTTVLQDSYSTNSKLTKSKKATPMIVG